MIPFLSTHTPFPPVECAQAAHGGLLALGGGLSPERLINAYRRGIFPWGTLSGEPVWYSPDPRMVLEPAQFHLSRSLRRTLRRDAYQVSINRDFAAVINACGDTPRPGQDGTWISPEMRAAYQALHELGWAHSVEVRMGGVLVGGLYGLAIGGAFFGESMFSHRTDASKIAMAHLCRYLVEKGISLIDCQMHTAHLASLGAHEIPRHQFVTRLGELISGQPAPNAEMTAPVGELRFAW